MEHADFVKIWNQHYVDGRKKAVWVLNQDVESQMMSTNPLPEQSINPPHLSDEEYERLLRNDLREEIMGAIDTIDDRLGELSPNGFTNTLAMLAELRDYLVRDMED